MTDPTMLPGRVAGDLESTAENDVLQKGSYQRHPDAGKDETGLHRMCYSARNKTEIREMDIVAHIKKVRTRCKVFSSFPVTLLGRFGGQQGLLLTLGSFPRSILCTSWEDQTIGALNSCCFISHLQWRKQHLIMVSRIRKV